jgi:hypothetical protein
MVGRFHCVDMQPGQRRGGVLALFTHRCEQSVHSHIFAAKANSCWVSVFGRVMAVLSVCFRTVCGRLVMRFIIVSFPFRICSLQAYGS